GQGLRDCPGPRFRRHSGRYLSWSNAHRTTSRAVLARQGRGDRLVKPGLNQSTQLRQELKINPRLYQAMDLLYMPLLDLQQHLKQELLNNPFLDLVEAEEEEEEEKEAEEEQQTEAEDDGNREI